MLHSPGFIPIYSIIASPIPAQVESSDGSHCASHTAGMGLGLPFSSIATKVKLASVTFS
jgi:hypothetical protein